MTGPVAVLDPLSDVLGHEELKARLRRVADSGRVPNGTLFVGEDGRGKRTLALAWAADLLARAARPEERARAARRATEGLHAELVILEPLPEERFLPVRRVRRLLERCSLSIAEGSRRVVVIPRLQKVNEESGNALLKFFEEPPPGTIVLASASAAGAVLETIRSRLVVLRVGPLSDADVKSVCVARGLPPEEADLLAAASAGAPGRAFRLRRGDVEAALIRPLRDLFDRSISTYAFAERLSKEAKEAGADWAEEEGELGPRAALAAFAELRAAKEEGADGETASAGTQEAARAWLRPVCAAAAFLAQDLVRLAEGGAPRAPALLERVGLNRTVAPESAVAADHAARAALAALGNLDRNLNVPLLLDAMAAAFRSLG